MNKKIKTVCLIVGLSLIISPFSSLVNNFSNVAKANEYNNMFNYEPSEEEINELAEALRFFDENSIKDENGNIVDYNFKKIEEKYGEHISIKNLKKEIEFNKYKHLYKSSYMDCMKEAMYDYFGVTAVTTMFSHSIGVYIEKNYGKKLQN